MPWVYAAQFESTTRSLKAPNAPRPSIIIPTRYNRNTEYRGQFRALSSEELRKVRREGDEPVLGEEVPFESSPPFGEIGIARAER